MDHYPSLDAGLDLRVICPPDEQHHRPREPVSGRGAGALAVGRPGPVSNQPWLTRLDAVPPGPLYLREGAEGWTALTPAVVLAGWRETADALRLLSLLSISRLDPVCLRMAGTGGIPGVPRALGTLSALVALISWPPSQRPALLADIAVAVDGLDLTRVPDDDAARAVLAVRHLREAHPHDPAVLTPLLLQAIELDAGACVELGPGTARLLLSGSVTTHSGREAVIGALDRGHPGVAARPARVTTFAGLLASESDIRRTRASG